MAVEQSGEPGKRQKKQAEVSSAKALKPVMFMLTNGIITDHKWGDLLTYKS